ncbi:MAG: hypothetical protein LQ343_001011 [Gyalolechia ehrenbergii]|nr:MAG: hypothetical protein LQ343_001011 [Gyalolechia ehrenbergii]
MGNDGGSIPTRRELVRQSAKDPSTTQIKETQQEKLEHYWQHCALSQKPLALPIVSDSTGNLYNKDAVLEKLLDAGQKSRDENVAGSDRISGAINSLRDVVEVRFTVDEEEESEQASSSPVRLCNETYFAENVIPILPSSSADKDRLRDRLSRLQSTGLTHSLKKAPSLGKKRKKAPLNKKGEATAVADVVAGPDLPLNGEATVPSSKAIRNEDTASLTAKVLAEQEDRNKRRKMAPNDNLQTLFSSSTGMDGRRADFMNRGFTIPAESKR